MLIERNARFSISFVAVLITTIFIIYEWDVFISRPNNHVLPAVDYYLSTPTSSNGHAKPEPEIDEKQHRVVYSASTVDKKYFFIDFVDKRSINPNILPHPSLKDTWIIVAQRHDPESELPMVFTEITCNAAFQNGILRCLDSTSVLPIDTIPGDKCEGDFIVLNLSQGPHDARVFFGPEVPYTVYGSNSRFNCFGQSVQDFRPLVDWDGEKIHDNGFKNATELQRPPPYGSVEKNWFIFWDSDGQMYVHYDVSPKRAFAKLELDGSVGEDLAPEAVLAGDGRCLAKYLPKLGPSKESIHQSTNSLSVTLCKRSEPSCKPNDHNTFVFTIFQLKRYRYFHSVYEPYSMLFEQSAPFKIHGISTKPFWVHGRWKPHEIESEAGLLQDEIEDGKIRNWSQTEMFYITSMSWKSHSQKYHGYIDDIVFLGFGIEDSQSAGIDVVVGDLLADICLC